MRLGRTASELEATMTAREFAELAAYWRIQPFGGWVDDLRVGRICATVANFSQAVDWKKRGQKPFEPADFMPAQPKPKQTLQEQKQALKDYTEAHNARILAAQQRKGKKRGVR